MNYVLDRALTAYSYLPHHPGKGWIYDRVLPSASRAWDKPRIRSRFGAKFECDLRDKLAREIYFVGFVRRDCRVLRRLIKPGDVILDVGANIGYFCLLFAKWLRGTGRVYAFEPFPRTVERLKRNLELNPRLKALVHLRETAVSDFVGSLSMSAPDEGNSGCNYLSARGKADVAVTTLDAFVQQESFSRVDLIKVDVEGSEVALLKGARETLERFRPLVMIEVNPSTLGRFQHTAGDVISLLGKYRYRLAYANRLGVLRPLWRLPAEGEEPNIFGFPID
jgi:FkbM family methyltransferase